MSITLLLSAFWIFALIDVKSLTADVSGVDWMVRHGRSMALAIAVKFAPEQLCTPEYSATILDVILSSTTADRVMFSC